MLVDEGTTIVKVFLNVSKEEQRRRLQERIDDPEKRWKFRKGDLDVRARFDEYIAAYDEVIEQTSTEHAPVVRRARRPQLGQGDRRRRAARATRSSGSIRSCPSPRRASRASSSPDAGGALRASARGSRGRGRAGSRRAAASTTSTMSTSICSRDRPGVRRGACPTRRAPRSVRARAGRRSGSSRVGGERRRRVSSSCCRSGSVHGSFSSVAEDGEHEVRRDSPAGGGRSRRGARRRGGSRSRARCPGGSRAR